MQLDVVACAPMAATSRLDDETTTTTTKEKTENRWTL